jgi:hypothetical protein
MRTALLIVVALALVLSVSAAWADPTAGWGKDNTNWSSATGAYTASQYVYEWDTYSWQEGSDAGTEGFAVTADIEMWLDMAFSATSIYFHIGHDPGPSPTFHRDVTGWLASNNGQHLFVSKPPEFLPEESEITKLVFMNDIGHREGQTADDIDVNWLLDDGGGFVAGTYSDAGNNGQLSGVQWKLNDGAVGYHTFTIRCEITPDRYQPDGFYEMDPVLVASPVL